MLSMLIRKDADTIRNKILLVLIPMLLVAWIIAMIAIYLSARFELSDMQNEQTYILAMATAQANGDTITKGKDQEYLQNFRHYHEDFLLRIHDNKGTLVFDSRLKQKSASHSDLERINAENSDWFLSQYALQSGAQVTIGRRKDEVSEVIWQMVWSALMPLTIVFLGSVLATFLAVKNGLSPLTALSGDLKRRTAFQLDAIRAEGQPKELTPIIHALNALFERITHAITRERQFIDDAAHELRTPLAAIKAQCQAVDHTSLSPEARKRFDNIVKGVDRATILSNRLLDQARADQSSTPKAMIELAPIIRKTIANLFPLAEEADLTIELIHTSPLSHYCAKEDMILILNNILMNAIKHCPKNGHIHVALYADRIQIEDSGPGIPASMRQKIFERFIRLDGDQNQGAGLGLSIVKSLAIRNELDISVSQSKSLGGACFEIRII